MKRTDFIEINDKKVLVSDYIEVLSRIPSHRLVNEFLGKNFFPRSYKVKVLKHNLEDEVYMIKLRSAVVGQGLIFDLTNRLEHFNYFSDYLLNQLLEKVEKANPDSLRDYKEDIWLMLIQVAHQKGISKDKLHELYKYALNLPVNLETASEYNNNIDKLFKDQASDLDGISKIDFEKYMALSGTTKELITVGLKYGVIIKEKILKQDIIDEIYKEEKKLIPLLVENTHKQKLEEMSIKELKEYIEEKKLDVVTELKKEDIVYLILRDNKANHENVLDKIHFDLPRRMNENSEVYVDTAEIERLKQEYMAKESEFIQVIKSKDQEIRTLKTLLEQKNEVEVVTKTTDSGSVVNIYLDRELIQTITPPKEETVLPKEVRPRVSKGLISMLIILLILATFVAVYILDQTGVVPRESTIITSFIFKIIDFIF